MAVPSTVVLGFLLGRLREHVKFFLLFAFLILIYSLAKKLHLSSLVLAFGLAVNNSDILLGWVRLRTGWRRFTAKDLAPGLHQLKSITAESAFLIHTFFFLLFRLFQHTVQPRQLAAAGPERTASGRAHIYSLSVPTLRGADLLPKLFIAPKGLMTVLLFYGILAAHVRGRVSESILFVVTLLTSLR